jgi:hypothetical protein
MLYNITPIAGLVTKILTFAKYYKCGWAIKLEYKTKIFKTILLCRYTAIFLIYYGIIGGRIGGWGIAGGVGVLCFMSCLRQTSYYIRNLSSGIIEYPKYTSSNPILI